VTSERETIAWSVSSVDMSSGAADPEVGVQLTRLRDLEALRDVTWVEAAECLNTWNSMGVWQVCSRKSERYSGVRILTPPLHPVFCPSVLLKRSRS
jgi:hypothetical protein